MVAHSLQLNNCAISHRETELPGLKIDKEKNCVEEFQDNLRGGYLHHLLVGVREPD